MSRNVRWSIVSPSLAVQGSTRTVLFLTFLAATALGATFGTSPSWAQVNTSSLRGTVVDTSGAPVTGAEVTLIHGPSSNVKVTTTNNSGAYAFTGLRVGSPGRDGPRRIGYWRRGGVARNNTVRAREDGSVVTRSQDSARSGGYPT